MIIILGVQSSSNGDKDNSSERNTTVYPANDCTVEDRYGNIESIRWPQMARFTIRLTSDKWIPVAPGSLVLRVTGETPINTEAENGIYAYNIVDCKCWKRVNDEWAEEINVVEFPDSPIIELFSSVDCTTTLSINNFRGECIYTAREDGNSVDLNIDDTLADILHQGCYTAHICKVIDDETKLIRCIPITVTNAECSDTKFVGAESPSGITIKCDCGDTGVVEATLED